MEKDTNATTDSNVLQECTKEWMSGAGGRVAVRATLRMLNDLYVKHGKDFTIAGSLDALDDLVETAQSVKRDLQKRTTHK